MLVRAFSIATAVALFALAFPRPANGYEPRETHRWLTRAAAEHLVRAYPGEYDEVLEYVDAMAEGAENEDNLFLDGDDDPETLRVMRHFYRPSDGAGLELEDRGSYRSSLEWAKPNDVNAWHWGNGIDAYAGGDREEAYFILGHLAHLVQDLTVPAHTHLDQHPPPRGDDFENYAASLTFGEHEADLPMPPEDAPVPEFENLDELWLATAEASYWRNLYPGDLSDPEDPKGVIAEMFPDIEMNAYWGEWAIEDPPVGYEGNDFFEDEPGLYYFKRTEYPAQVDVIDFDPADPRALDGLAENRDEAPMVELLARDLVPLAILHSAAVMKLYLDEAYAEAPEDPGAGEDELPPGQAQGAGCRAASGSGALAALLLVFLAYPMLWIRRAR